jgi:hypothetical protein
MRQMRLGDASCGRAAVAENENGWRAERSGRLSGRSRPAQSVCALRYQLVDLDCNPTLKDGRYGGTRADVTMGRNRFGGVND